jgi:hypothetical protein
MLASDLSKGNLPCSSDIPRIAFLGGSNRQCNSSEVVCDFVRLQLQDSPHLTYSDRRIILIRDFIEALGFRLPDEKVNKVLAERFLLRQKLVSDFFHSGSSDEQGFLAGRNNILLLKSIHTSVVDSIVGSFFTW